MAGVLDTPKADLQCPTCSNMATTSDALHHQQQLLHPADQTFLQFPRRTAKPRKLTWVVLAVTSRPPHILPVALPFSAASGSTKGTVPQRPEDGSAPFPPREKKNQLLLILRRVTWRLRFHLHDAEENRGSTDMV